MLTDEVKKMLIKAYGGEAPGEASVLAGLDPRRGWDFACDLTKFGSSDKGLGFRLAGTEAGKKTAEFVYQTFEHLGLNPEYHRFPVYASEFKDAYLKIEGLQEFDLPLVPESGAPGTGSDGISGELVFVGSATESELANIDLDGKIALVSASLKTQPLHGDIARMCERFGAAAVIYYCADSYGQEESGEAFWQGTVCNHRLSIPFLNTPKKYGLQLASMIKGRKYEASLVVDVTVDEEATGTNVIGRIEGQKYPDELIVLSAHLDAHFYGFQDDSLPLGVLVSIAEAMARANYKPDRTILFIAFDAEEFGDVGTHYTWLVGSWAYLQDLGAEWISKVVANINLEIMASREINRLGMYTSDTLAAFVRMLVEDEFEPQGYDQKSEVIETVYTWDDGWCFSYYGVPTVTTDYLNPLFHNTYYHSQFDIPERAVFERYADYVRAYAMMLIRIDRSPLAPYSLAATPGKYLQAVAAVFDSAGEERDRAIKAAQSYEQLAGELFRKQLLIMAHYRSKNGGEAVESAKIRELFRTYNRGLREAASVVIRAMQYLDQDEVSFSSPYYSKLLSVPGQAVSHLAAGQGQAFLDSFKLDVSGAAQHFTAHMDYDSWYESYKFNIEPEKLKQVNLRWGTGRQLKLYNTYMLLKNVRDKAAAGDQSYAGELAELSKIEHDLERRLRESLRDEAKAWGKAEKALPVGAADELMALLEIEQ